MNEHVPNELLASFVDGDVGEQLAVHIAEHLDACPSCATRAAGLEPLAIAFANAADPMVPADLEGDILAALAASPAPTGGPEVAVGSGLLILAGVVTMAGDFSAMATDFVVSLNAGLVLARSLLVGLGPFQATLAFVTLLVCFGCVLTARLAVSPNRFAGLQRRLM